MQSGGTVVEGGTVQLTADITGRVLIGTDVNFSIDLNGYTISNDNDTITHRGAGTVTISGGIVTATDASGKAILNGGSGKVEVSGGTVTAMAKQSYAIDNNSNVQVTVSNAAEVTVRVATPVNVDAATGVTQYHLTLSGNKTINPLTFTNGTNTITFSNDLDFDAAGNLYILLPTPASPYTSATTTETTAPATPNKDALKTGQATVVAPVDKNGNATVNITDKAVTDAIKVAQDAAQKENLLGKMIAIEIVAQTDKAATQITATLPLVVQETLIDNKVDAVKITTGTITMSFNQTAIQQMLW